MKVTMSAPRLKSWLLLASLLVTVSAARLGHAQSPSVGDIRVCYLCAESFGSGGSFLDGPTFVIRNTSGSDITTGILRLGPGVTDFFNVGTIPAQSRKIVAPGISSDRGTHTFFKLGTGCVGGGCIRDTSEVPPNGNDTQFEFTGRQGSNVVDSGVFTPAATQGDGMNFLGGPGDKDQDVSCGFSHAPDCFNKTVATLIVPSTFSKTIDQTLIQGATLFDFGTATGGPKLIDTLDYTDSGTIVPSGITARSTITWETDSGWGNQFDALTVKTPFFGKKCLHQQIAVGGNLVFACLRTLFVCSLTPSDPNSFSGANCPKPATDKFIALTLEFQNENVASSINGPGLIEGADNAQTCTPRPDCEALNNVFESITNGTIIVNGKPPHLSIFVPFSTP